MNLIDRAKNILFSPKTEWEKIQGETIPHVKMLTTNLLWLALIPAVAAFIGWGVIGHKVLFVRVAGFGLGIRYALMQFVSVIGGAYLTALAFYLVAPHFGAKKDFDKAFQLAAYCYTAVCAGGVFYIMWSLSFLAGIAGLYGLYILWLGVKPMLEVPEEKVTNYFIVALLCMVVISIVLGAILGAVTGVGTTLV